MSGEADYGFCMREEDGWLVLYYRPDVSMIAELISQWHEVREAMVMEEERIAGMPYDGKPRYRGARGQGEQAAHHSDGDQPFGGGMFNTKHELAIEEWATEMTFLSLWGDETPDMDEPLLDSESPFDSLLEELDS